MLCGQDFIPIAGLGFEALDQRLSAEIGSDGPALSLQEKALRLFEELRVWVRVAMKTSWS